MTLLPVEVGPVRTSREASTSTHTSRRPTSRATLRRATPFAPLVRVARPDPVTTRVTPLHPEVPGAPKDAKSKDHGIVFFLYL